MFVYLFNYLTSESLKQKNCKDMMNTIFYYRHIRSIKQINRVSCLIIHCEDIFFLIYKDAILQMSQCGCSNLCRRLNVCHLHSTCCVTYNIISVRYRIKIQYQSGTIKYRSRKNNIQTHDCYLISELFCCSEYRLLPSIHLYTFFFFFSRILRPAFLPLDVCVLGDTKEAMIAVYLFIVRNFGHVTFIIAFVYLVCLYIRIHECTLGELYRLYFISE